MKSVSDAWQLYRETQLAAFESEHSMRVLMELERAFFAGAESIVDDLQDLNAAGLTLPFDIARQLMQWQRETTAHHSQAER